MTELQFPVPRVSGEWCETHNTHIAVATAIHAIADKRRTPEKIWEDPTPAEWDHVSQAVENYILCGKFRPEPDGVYHWGMERIVVDHPDTPGRLFGILDGIIDSCYAEQTLDSLDDIQRYAEAGGQLITREDAQRIATVGKRWLDEQRNGNGEWSRMRHEAMDALENDAEE